MASTSSLDHQSYVVTTTTLTIIVSPTPIYRPTKHPTTSAAQATSGSVRNLYTDASFSRFPNDFLAIQNGAWVRPTFIAFSTFIATCLVASLVYYGWRWHKKRKPSEGAFVELESYPDLRNTNSAPPNAPQPPPPAATVPDPQSTFRLMPIVSGPANDSTSQSPPRSRSQTLDQSSLPSYQTTTTLPITTPAPLVMAGAYPSPEVLVPARTSGGSRWNRGSIFWGRD